MMKVTETKTTEKLFGKATPSAYLELSWKDSACVDVTGVGLNGFVVAQDLSSGSSWHGRKEKAVSDTMPGKESHELESFNQGRKERKDPGTNQEFSAHTQTSQLEQSLWGGHTLYVTTKTKKAIHREKPMRRK